MKSIKLALFIGAFVVTQVACKKCVTCTYTDDIGKTQTVESCKKSANEDLETDLTDQFGIYGTVTCTEK